MITLEKKIWAKLGSISYKSWIGIWPDTENSYACTLELFFLCWEGVRCGGEQYQEGCKRWVRENVLEKPHDSHGTGRWPEAHPRQGPWLPLSWLWSPGRIAWPGIKLLGHWSLHLATKADSGVCFLLHVKSGTRGSRAVLPRDINSKRRQESLSHIFRSGYVYVCLCIHTIFRDRKRKNGLKN